MSPSDIHPLDCPGFAYEHHPDRSTELPRRVAHIVASLRVASVAAPSLEWVPSSWWCEPCDPGSLVKVAMHLLHDAHAVDEGRHVLTDYVAAGTARWKAYLMQGA